MADDEHFRPAVRGTVGAWPSLPNIWSYSSLKEAEECPRRWMLHRASYPGVWERAGYPQRPVPSAQRGEVIHRVLEIILREFHEARCESLASPCAVEVLRRLGGYSKLIDQVIDDQLGHLNGNPRATDRIASLRSALRAQVPDIRQRVQAVVARSTIIRTGAVHAPGQHQAQRRPLGQGSYPEVELRAPDLRMLGRADLLTLAEGACTITDYKTGSPNEHHAEQLEMYAVLWSRDTEINPNGVPVAELVISYATHDVMLTAPTDVESAILAERLRTRIVEAESQLGMRPPEAKPDADMCGLCDVRHLCNDYWKALSPGNAIAELGQEPTFIDCEGTIVSQNGPRSWMMRVEPTSIIALVRTPTEAPVFREGDGVRLLGVVASRDDDSDAVVVSLTQASEAFVVDES
jgi:RecB family exonuclease